LALGCSGGFGLADWLKLQRLQAAQQTGVTTLMSNGGRPSAKSCILIWLDGGPSHLETFDPKPEAPREVRGPLGAISTTVPGVRLGECLPKTAQVMDQVALIRSVTSPLGEHQFGTHYMMTGYQPTPVLDYPAFGAVVSHTQTAPSVLPKNIAVPQFQVGGAGMTGGGFLPLHHQPFSVGADPAKPDFQVSDLDFYPGLGRERVDRRMAFVQSMNRMRDIRLQGQGLQGQGLQGQGLHGQVLQDHASRGDKRHASQLADPLKTPRATSHLGDSVDGSQNPGIDPDLRKAYDLMTSRDAQAAFEIQRESDAVRQAYGHKTVGQCCLLARRLVERGVPFVTVNHKGWDTHNQLVTRLKDGFAGARTPVGLIPSLDQALNALIVDLGQRGMLDETLVVVMGEFGRTPKLNTAGGRDHWPRVFSVLMAGGGTQGGQVVGSSDPIGESPADRPVTPSDLAATIYSRLGIDPSTEIHTPDGRPVRLTPDGAEVISELI
ncbi:MAG: DUF1501 domain-containing protein, partial [Rubripirellula sp.]|nr:DUF1501 domain-containing protein [Rubripirellula sp.]